MDLFTHMILGAAVGGMIASKKIGNKAIFWGGILSLIPNIDMLFLPFLDSSHAVLFHRGFSHSIFFFFIISPFIAMGMHAWQKNIQFSKAQWTKFVFVILLTHSLLDVFTSYGTGLLEPFSSKRFALSSIACVDLFYTIPIAIFVIIALKVKELRLKKVLSWLAVFVGVLYLCFTFLNKLYIQSQFEKHLISENIRFQKTEVFPASLGSNFKWNCIAQDRDGFWLQRRSNFFEKDTQLQLYLRNDYYMFDFENDKRVLRLKQFSRGYYSAMKRSGGVVDYRDLRFGKIGDEHDAPFICTFKIETDSKGDIISLSHANSFLHFSQFK